MKRINFSGIDEVQLKILETKKQRWIMPDDTYVEYDYYCRNKGKLESIGKGHKLVAVDGEKFVVMFSNPICRLRFETEKAAVKEIVADKGEMQTEEDHMDTRFASVADSFMFGPAVGCYSSSDDEEVGRAKSKPVAEIAGFGASEAAEAATGNVL